jgi:hypothetical protein
METINYTQFLATLDENWEPGEHITIIAPTGGGKSWIAADILSLRQWVVVIATKARDKTLETRYKDLARRSTWPPDYTQKRVLLWKKPARLGDFQSQQLLIYSVLADIYVRGGYTVYFDDVYYISNTLKLKSALQMFYTQVRSGNVSILASIQRPSWVPIEVVGQATYLIMLKIRDIVDIERVAQGVGLSKKELIAANETLQGREFLLLQSGHAPIHVLRSGE